METTLTRDAKNLIILNGLFTFGSTLSGVFTNIFLWKLTNDIVKIAMFNLVAFAGIIAFFPIAGYISKKQSITRSLKLGLLLLSGFYMLILYLGKECHNHLLSLGALFGAAQAFYYLAYNQMCIVVTNPGNRDEFQGVNGVLSAIAGIFPPAIAGFIITRFPGIIGYDIMFGITLLVFLGAGFMAMRLEIRSKYHQYNLLHVLWNYRIDGLLLNLSQFFIGLREGIYSFLVGIIMFKILKDENSFGMMTAFAAFVSMVAYSVVAKKMNSKNRMTFLFSMCHVLVAAPLLLILLNNFWGVVTYNLIMATILPFILIPFNSYMFNIIEKLSHKHLQIEYLVVREIYLNAGRIMGILILISVLQGYGMDSLKYFLPIINISYFITYLFYKKIQKDFKNKHVEI